MIKQSLKFLNTFRLSLKHKIMLLVWQGFQVLRAVIIFNTIEMMHNPSFRQRFAMGLFPNQYVFQDINTVFRCFRMFRIIDKNITVIFNSAPSPVRMLTPFLQFGTIGVKLPPTLTSTTMAKFGVRRLPTLFAGMFLCKIFSSKAFVPSFFILIHRFIISYFASKCEYNSNMSYHFEDLIAIC